MSNGYERRKRDKAPGQMPLIMLRVLTSGESFAAASGVYRTGGGRYSSLKSFPAHRSAPGRGLHSMGLSSIGLGAESGLCPDDASKECTALLLGPWRR
jgi:hypothetical protein